MDPRWQGGPLNAFAPGWEDGVPRVTAHESARVSKLKALGNAVVPQIPYLLMLLMLEADRDR